MSNNEKGCFIFRSHADDKTSNAERSTSNAESCYLLAALAAATILSKRLSPRKESQHGLKRRSPYVGPPGTVATISSCSSARSCSPVHAQTTARLVTQVGPSSESAAIGMRL